MKHIYNLQPQAKDSRDFKFAILKAMKLPQKVDLREKCPPVFDQGNLGSCTANVGVAAYMMLKNIRNEMSRLFLYYEERRLEGDAEVDAGATMRSIGKALNKTGVCLEAFWPYVVENYSITPSENAYKNAFGYKIASYKMLNDVTAIKQYIAKIDLPVMIGMNIYKSFESIAVTRTGIVPMPNIATEELLGGHAILIVGYNNDFKNPNKNKCIFKDLLSICPHINKEENGYFIARNSWGANWGDHGYFYLPCAYVNKYAYDFWVID